MCLKELEVLHGLPPSFLLKFSSKIHEFLEVVLMALCYSFVLHQKSVKWAQKNAFQIKALL